MKPDSEWSTTKGMTSSYNRDSKTQHEDFVRYLDTLLECVEAAEVEGTQLYSLIDYGCSLGANSILAMNRLIQYIHEHKSVDAFSANHNDLPSNDFNALLNNLGSSSHNYQNISGCRVSTQLVPASFFQQVVPDRQIDLGFTVAAVHWLTRIPNSNYKDAVFLYPYNAHLVVKKSDMGAQNTYVWDQNHENTTP